MVPTLHTAYTYSFIHIRTSSLHHANVFFSVVALVLIELEFADVGFCGGRKTGEPKNSWSKVETNTEVTQKWHLVEIKLRR